MTKDYTYIRDCEQVLRLSMQQLSTYPIYVLILRNQRSAKSIFNGKISLHNQYPGPRQNFFIIYELRYNMHTPMCII